ncbi:9865_t:CDS:10 [Ambispora gerdemannii]|uniref:non-specific serine/threonine protein kinase n=1 Tax=Ambispora gerdemannii TaxID=144530 RepID=A0A9N8Z592_9GLOM|nr:9865_t:CDS:10 [Ambispora gerdemannii]
MPPVLQTHKNRQIRRIDPVKAINNNSSNNSNQQQQSIQTSSWNTVTTDTQDIIIQGQQTSIEEQQKQLLPSSPFFESSPLIPNEMEIDPELINYDAQQLGGDHNNFMQPQINPKFLQETTSEHNLTPPHLSDSNIISIPSPEIDHMQQQCPPSTSLSSASPPLLESDTLDADHEDSFVRKTAEQPRARSKSKPSTRKTPKRATTARKKSDPQSQSRKTTVDDKKTSNSVVSKKRGLESSEQDEAEEDTTTVTSPAKVENEHSIPSLSDTKKTPIHSDATITPSFDKYSPASTSLTSHSKTKSPEKSPLSKNALSQPPPLITQPTTIITPEQDLRAYLSSIPLPPRAVTHLEMLRIGTFLFDQLLSRAFSRPFVNPEAEDALVYRSMIKDLMDLTTAEQKLWARKYATPNELYVDICQIMFNAYAFHREKDVIYEEAKQMAISFKQLVSRISNYLFGCATRSDPIVPDQVRLPHEDFKLSKVKAHTGSRLYIMPMMTYEENKKASHGLTQAAAERFDPLSRPLMELFNAKKLPPMRFEPSQQTRNFARMYVSSGRTAIERCRDDPDSLLIILSSVVWHKPTNGVRCKALIAKPFGRRHDLDTLDFPELADARSWIRVTILDRTEIDSTMSSKFYHTCLRTPYSVSLYDKKFVSAERHEDFINSLNLPRYNPSSNGPNNIWQNLCLAVPLLGNPYEFPPILSSLRAQAEAHDVPFESMALIGDSINIEAEGFFKRVFHIQDDSSIVIQNFKEINENTLSTRIVETVCCLKTKGLENTGQIISIYKGAEEELVGISMKRYEQTLKEYAFNARRLLTPDQKYKLILDMVNGIKSIHSAGFAHRDLSEVNMMVTEHSDERLSDGSVKPELVIIDFGKAVFVRVQDVRQWVIGEVSDETIDLLPRIQTVPDHGYKLYRSIATLPRAKNDSELLPQPIDPLAEDVYSLGILIWRIFSGQAPWSGILDTDLKELRSIVSDSTKILFHIDRSVPGNMSRQLLLRCITVDPQSRNTSEELHDFLTRKDVKEQLLAEWAMLGGRVKKEKKY